MHNIYFILIFVYQTAVAFFVGTFAFDVLHYLLHQCLKAKSPRLKAIGRLHKVHHFFYSNRLKIRKEYARRNLYYQVILEYITQLLATLSCSLFLPWQSVGGAILIETTIFVVTCFCRGEDPHHRPIDNLKAHSSTPFVGAHYHALHHIYPNQFFSSYIKIIDYFLGTSLQLNGKRIAMTGANGALGKQMKLLLEREGAEVTTLKSGVDYDEHQYDQAKIKLKNKDILFLCHGTKYEHTEFANCDSFVNLIELFKTTRTNSLVPLEVWGVGSEIECHPCFGIKSLYPYAKSKRRFASFARYYYHDQTIQYKHLVHSAFSSQMGPGLISASTAAKITLFLLKRGLKYIPVTYTGFAWLNYIKFRTFSRQQPDQAQFMMTLPD